MGDSGHRSFPEDPRNLALGCVRGNVRDYRSGNSARDPGRYLPRCRTDCLGDHGRRNPGDAVPDGPADDVRDCPPDEGL